jgi:iron complex outermembrane receptor protein
VAIRSSIRVFPVAALLALAAASAWGQAGLADASLEQLLNTQITTASKTQQDLGHTAAAVFVITQEDIRRSGAANLPDVLRMAPGVQVNQITANSWAITIRGFNNFFSDKVLVMVDGRSIYAPSFGGVYWDQADMPLESIERIEVILGPASSVWGANAMNGVINIITKNPKSTKGGTFSARADSSGGVAADSQFSGDAGPNGAYRVFGQVARFGDDPLPTGDDGVDAWSRVHGGFRADWNLTPSDNLTADGSAFYNRESQYLNRWFYAVPGDSPTKSKLMAEGGDIRAKWTHTFSGGSSASLQAFYDAYHRDNVQLQEHSRTFDVDFQHHFKAGGRHEIVWGFGYRSQGTASPVGTQVTLVGDHSNRIFNVFFQDQIRLNSRLWLTVGCKLEHNSYTGLEREPSARLAWAPTAKQTFWAAAAKGLRDPSRVETGVSMILAEYPLSPTVVERIPMSGNPHQRAERLNDFEVGYRRQWNDRLSLDLDSFLSFYRDLSTYQLGTPSISLGSPLIISIPAMYANGGKATDYGGEASLTWRVNSRWRIAPGYSMVAVNFRGAPGSNDPFSAGIAGNSPRHSVQTRSWISLTRRLEFDQTVYWTEHFPNGSVAGHTRVDARLAWKAGESMEVSLTGQNLLRPGFLDFGDFESAIGTLAPRTLIAKVTWKLR